MPVGLRILLTTLFLTDSSLLVAFFTIADDRKVAHYGHPTNKLTEWWPTLGINLNTYSCNPDAMSFDLDTNNCTTQLAILYSSNRNSNKSINKNPRQCKGKASQLIWWHSHVPINIIYQVLKNRKLEDFEWPISQGRIISLKYAIKTNAEIPPNLGCFLKNGGYNWVS